jgi:hypothetical protein
MFNIGDTAFVPKYGQTQTYITCPDCLGKKYLTVILGDESKVTIDCDCCREQFEPKGMIRIYKWQSGVEQITIDGVETQQVGDKLKTRYRVGTHCCYHSYEEDEVFATAEEAQALSDIRTAEHEVDEQNQIENKKRWAHKSWASHVTYYRSALKHVEEEVERYKKLLSVAESKVK